MNIIVLCGKSGTGKDYVIKKIEGAVRVPSKTTRGQRAGEVDGVDMFFCSEEDYLKDENKFAETKSSDGYYYWKSLDDFFKDNKDKICILEPTGVLDLLRITGWRDDIKVYVVELRANERTRFDRLIEKSQSVVRDRYKPQNVQKVLDRMARDKNNFSCLGGSVW